MVFRPGDIGDLEDYAKEFGAKGLAYAKVEDGKLTAGVAKFIEDLSGEIIKATDAKDGDLIFFVADERAVANKVLGMVRSKLGDILELKDPNKLSFVWITDFPFYEMDEKTGGKKF